MFCEQEMKEKRLNRESATAVVRVMLKTFEERNLLLDELWDVRSEQLTKSRKIKTEFVQFEKDTKGVCCIEVGTPILISIVGWNVGSKTEGTSV